MRSKFRKGQTVLISKFATQETADHSLVDDLRYFGFFLGSGVDFRMYTSRYSINCILEKYPDGGGYLFAIEKEEIQIGIYSKVVFLGFSERDIFVFLLKNFLRRPKLVLVATNNYSRDRVKRYHTALRLFLLLVRPFLHRLVLHTSFERHLIASLDSFSAARSVVKKHHLMTPTEVRMDCSTTRPVISYFGPVKHDKPIEPFLELVRADTARKFDYRIYRVTSTIMERLAPDITGYENVALLEDWQSRDRYLESVNASTLVFLTHSRRFEGKLSGNLCDSFSLGVPYLARTMEPMISYHSQYGELGYMFDLDSSDWTQEFLSAYDEKMVAEMQDNLKRLGIDHSFEAVNESLRACFLV